MEGDNKKQDSDGMYMKKKKKYPSSSFRESTLSWRFCRVCTASPRSSCDMSFD